MIKVLKFGGTSMADAAAIKQVAAIVGDTEAEQVIVVVSAAGGVTNALLQLGTMAAQQDKNYPHILSQIKKKHLGLMDGLFEACPENLAQYFESEYEDLQSITEGVFKTGELTPRVKDRITSFGERISAALLGFYLEAIGINAGTKDSRELIQTNTNFGNAAVLFTPTERLISSYFAEKKYKVTVVPGFMAASTDGAITTLGRGGSDYTAAIIANILDAEIIEIWTDVSGMYTANPSLVRQAKAIKAISYEEAMELSHFGAKVIFPPTIQPALEKSIPILIKNTFKPEAKGTLISANKSERRKAVRGITYIPDISLVTLEGPGMIGIPGIARRIFDVLTQENISVVLITQASSEHSICMGISSENAGAAENALNRVFNPEIALRQLKPVLVEHNHAVIALVGDLMKSHQGLSGRMFSTLGKNNVNIRAIAQGASERNISAVIDAKDVKKALNALHETFFEVKRKQLNLYVIGAGNVGARFLDLIKQQDDYLKNTLKLQIRIIGLTNSRTMVLEESGIDLNSWEEQLASGKQANLDQFIETIQEYNLRNSILVDNTANESVAGLYSELLSRNIGVVTCNKIACSSDYQSYLDLIRLAGEFQAPFLFETNVGAGLPVIDTLKHLVASGDSINRIEAVLSGSLNFVFNSYTGEKPMAEIVRQAQEEGYTEPDPKIDLSGVDVMRKILILARVSGYQMELSDIKNDQFLPQEALEANDLDTFYEALLEEESYFKSLYQKAAEKGATLKYVAKFEDGKASVGLEEIAKEHEFYSVKGSDNTILFYTDRYPEQPLMIKGAGAGAAVTASGIFADIVRIAN